jgi:hypothetical protein
VRSWRNIAITLRTSPIFLLWRRSHPNPFRNKVRPQDYRPDAKAAPSVRRTSDTKDPATSRDCPERKTGGQRSRIARGFLGFPGRNDTTFEVKSAWRQHQQWPRSSADVLFFSSPESGRSKIGLPQRQQSRRKGSSSEILRHVYGKPNRSDQWQVKRARPQNRD